MNALLGKFIEPFDRQARLYPALLTIVPVFFLTLSIFPIKLSILSSIISALAGLGVLFLASQITRRLGKKIEKTYFDSIGGKPTTILLRHTDNRVDKITKKRYHEVLSWHLKQKLPSAKQEEKAPADADALYSSAISLLLEKTRDVKKYPLVLKESIHYNFIRNANAAKPLGILLSGISLCVSLSCLFRYPDLLHDFIKVQNQAGLLFNVTLSLGMLLIWFRFFSIETMNQAAFTFARQLLKTLDAIPSGPPQKNRRTSKKK